jgi:hypothetical protein
VDRGLQVVLAQTFAVTTTEGRGFESLPRCRNRWIRDRRELGGFAVPARAKAVQTMVRDLAQ